MFKSFNRFLEYLLPNSHQISNMRSHTQTHALNTLNGKSLWISTEYQQSGEQRPRCVWRKAFFFTHKTTHFIRIHPKCQRPAKWKLASIYCYPLLVCLCVCDAVRECSSLATFPLIRIEIHFDDSDRNAGIEWLPGQFMAINRFSINSNIPSMAFSLCVLHLRCSPKPNSIKFECLNDRDNGKRIDTKCTFTVNKWNECSAPNRFSHAILINLHGQQKRLCTVEACIWCDARKICSAWNGTDGNLSNVDALLSPFARVGAYAIICSISWVHCKQKLRNVIACIFALTNKQIDWQTDSRTPIGNMFYLQFAFIGENIINSSIDLLLNVTNSFAHWQRNDVELVNRNVS